MLCIYFIFLQNYNKLLRVFFLSFFFVCVCYCLCIQFLAAISKMHNFVIFFFSCRCTFSSRFIIINAFPFTHVAVECVAKLLCNHTNQCTLRCLVVIRLKLKSKLICERALEKKKKNSHFFLRGDKNPNFSSKLFAKLFQMYSKNRERIETSQLNVALPGNLQSHMQLRHGPESEITIDTSKNSVRTIQVIVMISAYVQNAIHNRSAHQRMLKWQITFCSLIFFFFCSAGFSFCRLVVHQPLYNLFKGIECTLVIRRHLFE